MSSAYLLLMSFYNYIRVRWVGEHNCGYSHRK